MQWLLIVFTFGSHGEVSISNLGQFPTSDECQRVKGIVYNFYKLERNQQEEPEFFCIEAKKP